MLLIFKNITCKQIYSWKYSRPCMITLTLCVTAHDKESEEGRNRDKSDISSKITTLVPAAAIIYECCPILSGFYTGEFEPLIGHQRLTEE